MRKILIEIRLLSIWISVVGLFLGLNVQAFATGAQTAAQSVAAVPGQYAKGKIVEAGGSNYTFYDMGNSASGVIPWNTSLRPVIATYHLNPSAVESQMRALFKSGQRQITFVLWYAPMGTSIYSDQYGTDPTDVKVYMANSSGGQLSTQAQANFRAILRLVKVIGFDQVTLRFAGMGDADASAAWWAGGNPALSAKAENLIPWGSAASNAQLQENLNFILGTRSLMENELSGTSIRRLYDLGVELGGLTVNNAAAYVQSVWQYYVLRYGKTDSYGFSIAVGTGRMSQLITSLLASGVGLPPYYAIDTYGSTDVALTYTYNEMLKKGEGAKPIIIQETFTNDPNTAQEIIAALNSLPMTIQSINQWPEYSWAENIGLTPSTQYNLYGGSDSASGSIVSQSCVLQTGQTSCRSQISWATTNASNVQITINGKLMAALPAGTVSAPWIGPGANVFEINSDQGSLGSVSIEALTAGTPTLDAFGAELSGPTFSSVIATGTNIPANCTVNIYTPDWSNAPSPQFKNPAQLAQLTGSSVICQPNSVTFNIPSSVQSLYKEINFNVTSATEWSSPIAVSIALPVPVIYEAGLGCSANQCIWASGANISSACQVSIFSADNSANLGTVTDVNCHTNSVSFTIPAGLQEQYGLVNLQISNLLGGPSTASAPFAVRIGQGE